MLLGDCDQIVHYLCAKLGWHLPSIQPNKDVVGEEAAVEVKEKVASIDEKEDKEENKAVKVEEKVVAEPERLMNSHAWLFDGAEPGRLPALLAEMEADAEEGDEDDEEEEEVSKLLLKPLNRSAAFTTPPLRFTRSAAHT